MARVNHYEEWTPFEVAKLAYERFDAWGVGTLLTGDGFVVVDLDKCIHDGVIDPRAIDVLKALNISYVEYSPSGSGLHGWGLLEGCYSTRPVVAGLQVELYTQKRFMTVTGQVLWDRGIQPINPEPLQCYRRPDASEDAEDREDKEDMESHSSFSSASSVASMVIDGKRYELPNSCIPTGFGSRNAAIFEFARFVKGKHPRAGKPERMQYVEVWFSMFADKMSTKDVGESYVDFEHAWSRVKYPHGEEWLKVRSLIDSFVAPPHLEKYGQRMCKIYQLCRALESTSADGVFFIGLGQAAEELGCDEATVSRHLVFLIKEEIITVAEPHVPNKRARRLTFHSPVSQSSASTIPRRC